MHSINTESNIVVVQPEIDIISMKMLSVMGCEASPVTFKVRRKLFGCCSDVKAASVKDSLTELENKDVQRSSQVWNFDFTTDSPLPAGRYVWEKVRDCDVPVWYTSDNNDLENRRACNQEKNAVCGQFSKSRNSDQIKYHQGNRWLVSNQHRFVQTNIKGYTKVQKKTLKRLNSKNNSGKFLKGASRVADYILRNQDASTNS